MSSKSGGGLTGFLSSPTGWILAAGTIYIAYQIWKEIKKTKKQVDPLIDESVRAGAGVASSVANLVEGSNPRIQQRLEPIAPVKEDYLAARIVGDPVNGQWAWDWRVTVEINNPGAPRVVNLQLKSRNVSSLLPDSTSETSGNVNLPTGRALFDIFIARPTMLSEISYEYYFQAFIDGKMAGPHKFFSP